MKDSFDQALCEHFLATHSAHLNSKFFIRAYAEAIYMFIDKEDIDLCNQAMDGDEPASSVVLKRVLETRLGATLFKHLAVKHEWNSFLDLAAERLDALEFHDFEQEETASFKLLMTRDGNELQKKRSFGGMDQKTQEVKFMAGKISTHVSCINDAWALPLAARLKTVACNTGALAMFPWEKALHIQPGNIDGVRSALQIPEEMLAEYVNCREAALSILKGVSHGSVHDWKKALNSQYKALVALDRTWQLDSDYLNNYAEKDIITKLHSDLLFILPSAEVAKKIEAVIDSIKLIKNTPLTLAGGSQADKIIDGVLSLLRQLQDGVSPDDKEIARYDNFFKLVLKRAENFCTALAVPTEHAAKAGTKKVARSAEVLLFGLPALEYKVEQLLKATVDDAPQQLLAQAKETRAFEWLLSPKMRVDLHKRVQELIRKCMMVNLVPILDDNDRKGKTSKQLQADCDKAKVKSMVIFTDAVSTASSSSSSFSSGKKAGLDKSEKKDKMWRYFCGSAKSAVLVGK